MALVICRSVSDYSRRKPLTRLVACVAVLAVAMSATWFVARSTAPQGTEGTSAGTATGQTHSTSAVAGAPTETLIEDEDALDKFVENSTGSQLSYYRLSDGMRMGTATERYARPALSLIKLYLAEYVIENGSDEERYEAIAMVSDSSDVSADEFFDKYPDAIDDVAKRYGLHSTRAGARWGYSVTSTYDVVNFITQLKEQSPTHPILVGMASSTEVAADGYEQDFGTSRLNNVLGSKWGWSDDRTLHSSVSFGENFVVAAAVTGSAKDLTKFVRAQVTTTKLREATRHHLNMQEKKSGARQTGPNAISVTKEPGALLKLSSTTSSTSSTEPSSKPSSRKRKPAEPTSAQRSRSQRASESETSSSSARPSRAR